MAVAVSFRHGSEEEHQNWNGGVQAEITVDTTKNTVWVHPGAGATGIPLARADLDNVNESILYDPNNKFKLLKFDLTNFRGLDYSSHYESGKNKVLGTDIASYLDLPTKTSIEDSYAKKDMSNVNTHDLATNHVESGGNGDKNLAYYDLSNVDASYIVNKGIAKTDLSNINSSGQNVIDNRITTKLSAYGLTSDSKYTTDINNINQSLSSIQNNYQNKNERVTSSNVSSYNDDSHYPTVKAVNTLISGSTSGIYEVTTNKSQSISASDTNYPTNTAVINYVTGQLSNKVNKLSSSTTIYCTDDSGNQIGIDYSNDNDANTIALRDENAQISIAETPTQDDHAASKKYVDTGLSSKVDSTSLATVATTGSYTDLINKPTIPAAQIQSNWNETSTTSKAYIQNKPNVVVQGDISSTYSSSGTAPINGTAVETQHFVRGTSDSNSSVLPTHIAVYPTDALASAASTSHPTWVCFSLGQ